MLLTIFKEFNLSAQFKCVAPEIEEASRYYGLFSRVARRLGVTPQHVRQVARGLHMSRRVTLAINREVRRIREASREKAA
jgi:DNA-binding transcriptional regulator YdaS (Cro superfamily)